MAMAALVTTIIIVPANERERKFRREKNKKIKTPKGHLVTNPKPYK
jgi:hypothetical protein